MSPSNAYAEALTPSVTRPAIAEHHTLGGLNNRHLLFPSSGGRQQGRVLVKAFFMPCKWPPSLGVLTGDGGNLSVLLRPPCYMIRALIL